MEADGDSGGAGGRNVVVAEAPLFFVRQIDRGAGGRLPPRLGQHRVIGVVAVDVGEFLACFAGAVLVGIDEGFEAGAVAVEDFGDGIVVAVVTVGNVEPDVFDGQIGMDDELVARATNGVPVAGREEHGAIRWLRVVVEHLRESVVERGGVERAAALPVG